MLPHERAHAVRHVEAHRRDKAKGRVNITAMTLDGKPVFNRSFNYTASPLTSSTVFSERVGDVIGQHDRGDIIVYTEFVTGDRTYTNVGFPTKQKYMNYTSPTYSIDIAEADGGYDVTIGSDRFARGVFLSLEGIDNFFSDNYFNILPGDKHYIHVTTPLQPDEFKSQLKVVSLGDVYADAVVSADSAGPKRDGEFKPLGGN